MLVKKKPIKGPNKLVCDVLAESSKPLGAYEILERVKVMGINGPPTVYRALNKLVKLGMAHRVASTRTYVMCRHGSEHAAEAVVMIVCNFCDNVTEVPSPAIHKELENIRVTHGFKVRDEIIEISGMCRNCSSVKGKG